MQKSGTRRQRISAVVGLALLFVLCFSSAAWSTTAEPSGLRLISRAPAGGSSATASFKPKPSETKGVIVEYGPGTSKATMRQAAAGSDAVCERAQAGKAGSRSLAVYTSKTLSTKELMAKFRSAPGVVQVSPNNINTICTTPNDEFFADLWGLNNPGTSGSVVDADVDAPEAWDLTTGSPEVVVAILDSGVAYTHRDLAANMWLNPGEIPGDGIDNDNNGYVDDVHGIDVYSGDSDPWDENGHGTHVAGTAAAVGNNGISVVGVAWQAKIMALRFLGPDGSGEDAGAIECINYAIDMKLNHGVNIVAINASWGSYGPYDSALADAIEAAGGAGIVFCAAAGNGSANIDTAPFYPASLPSSDIVSVGASDAWDARAFFGSAGASNYGAASVDLFAPGKSILSTSPGYPNYYPAAGDPFFDNMDSGADNWIAEGTWAITSELYASGTHSWSDSPNANYANNEDSSLSTQSLDLRALAPHDTVLGFYTAFSLEDGYDFLQLEVSGDGGSTWSVLGYLTGTEDGGYYNAPLPEEALTDQCRVRFRLVTDDSVTQDGVHIDDVGISSFAPEECVFLSGTSMATPYVTGTVALLASIVPSESAATRIDRILSTVDQTESLSALCFTGGRLNAAAAITAAIPAPTVTSLTPAAGSTSGGNTVVIEGTAFVGVSGPSAVTFGGVNATSYSVNSTHGITAVAPPHEETGTVDVVVSSPMGPSDPSGTADDYTYLARYQQTDPHIVYSNGWSSFSTTSASGGGYLRAGTAGSQVTIYFSGTRLDWIAMMGTTTGKADVYLDDVFAKTVSLSNSTPVYQQNVWSTGALPAGAHKVRISWNTSNAAGKFITLDAVDLQGTLTSAPPAISGLSPNAGSIDGGASVTITGSDLTGASSVTFGGTSATSYSVDSATQMTAIAPAHEAGTVQVQVATLAGSTRDTAADDYTYAEVTVPTITSLKITSGSTAGGTSVVISGSGFIGVSAVTFGGANAKSYTVNSVNQITAVTPAHAAGTVGVRVTAAGGTTYDTPAGDFTYVAPLTKYQQNLSSFVYSGTWSVASATSASAGSYRRSSTAGASVIIPFNGTRLDWIATKSTTMGKADIWVDNVFTTTVDLYRSSTSYQNNVWSTGTLAPGYHTVKISRSTDNLSGKYIDIDAVLVAGTPTPKSRVEQTDSHLVWAPGLSAWTLGTASTTYFSGGSYRYTNEAGSVTIDFTGVSLDIIAKKAPSYGIAKVTLDGTKTLSVNLYSSVATYKKAVWSSGFLTPGNHSVTIEWTGTKSGSTGTTIDLDALDVRGVLR